MLEWLVVEQTYVLLPQQMLPPNISIQNGLQSWRIITSNLYHPISLTQGLTS